MNENFKQSTLSHLTPQWATDEIPVQPMEYSCGSMTSMPGPSVSPGTIVEYNTCALAEKISLLAKIFGMTKEDVAKGCFLKVDNESVRYIREGILLGEFKLQEGNNIVVNFFADQNFNEMEGDLTEKVKLLIKDVQFYTNDHRIEHGLFLDEKAI